MDYENIFKLQQSGFSFEDAKEIDSRGIAFDDGVACDEYQEELMEIAEHKMDLEERGFYCGTDNPHLIDQMERQEVFQDKYDMYMNEY